MHQTPVVHKGQTCQQLPEACLRQKQYRYQKYNKKEKSKEKIISEIDNFVNEIYILQVTTYHSFCNNIIDEYSIEIGVTQDPYIENNIDNLYKDVIDNLWIDDFLNLNHELISAIN